MDVVNFSIFGGGLLHDAMHDILEGVAQYEIKLVVDIVLISSISPLLSIITKFCILIMVKMNQINLVLLPVNFICHQLKHYYFVELLL